MTAEQTLAGTNEATDALATQSSQETQAVKEARTYTQEEFDSHMAGMKASLQKKLLKPYEDLGDVTELRELKAQAAKKAQEEQLKRGEFDKIIADLAAKKDSEIQKRDRLIEEFKVEQPLLSIAGEFRSVNPEQVKKLLRPYVRLNGDGEVEVTDDKGTVRYGDDGKPLAVKDLVKNFLSENPHFVQATPATTNSSHSVKSDSNSKIDISKLDMNNPDDRAIYREYRKTHGVI
jgi:hypothetical protein